MKAVNIVQYMCLGPSLQLIGMKNGTGQEQKRYILYAVPMIYYRPCEEKNTKQLFYEPKTLYFLSRKYNVL